MATDPADAPKVVKVAEGLYVRQEVDNITWIDMGGYALVVDALERPETESDVFDAIASTIGDLPIRYVLNTHTHYDHVALNAAFRRRCGAEIINQDTSPLPAAGRWFEGTRRRALMRPMPGCHTAADSIVWVPGDRALMVGDIFGWGLIPLSGRLDAETGKLLLDTYARLIAYDAATVIPGHGPLATTAELKRWVEYFRWLHDECVSAVAEGTSDRQARRDIAPPEDMHSWWRFLQWKHGDSLSKVLAAVHRGWRIA